MVVAVVLFADYSASGPLASDEAPLEVAREPVGPVGRLLQFNRPLTGRVFHASVAVDVAEQKVTALLPPHRTVGRPAVAADTAGELVDWLADANNNIEFWSELLDPLRPLCGCDAGWSKAERCSPGRGRRQKISTRELKGHDDPPMLGCHLVADVVNGSSLARYL
jgi:hypothetical protein